MRRSLDTLLSGLALLVLALPMLLVGLLVKLDSRGPALFTQIRVGKHERLFLIYKFRTMVDSGAGLQVTVARDHRITRVGRILRSTKIDELPQLLNVLHGDMALVGPRPEVPEYVALWPHADRSTVLSVRPGITDPAAIRYRRESEILAGVENPDQYYRDVLLPDKVAMYVEYVQNRSLVGDVRILVRTLRSMIAD